MSKYARKPNKVRVARYATPDQVISVTPITDRYLSMSTAKEVLDCRHGELKSWRILAYELAEPHPTLTGIVKRGRMPTEKLIKKLNNTYGTHLHYIPRAVQVPPCPTCGTVTVAEVCPRCHPPKPKRQRRPDPVVRVARVDAARIAALSALYAQRGIGEARYRIGLKRELDAMTG